MGNKNIVREWLVIPDENIECHICDIKILKDGSSLVLNCPKEGYHYHYYKTHQGITGHIKDNVGKKEETNIKPYELFDNIVSKKLKLYIQSNKKRIKMSKSYKNVCKS